MANTNLGESDLAAVDRKIRERLGVRANGGGAEDKVERLSHA
jgi:hypothetical protein